MSHLYTELANRFAQSIKRGIMQPGDKLPGVRSTSKNEGVSPSTVVSAYRFLESEGYIEARARSGFYVCSRLRSELAEPNITRPVSRPKAVTGQELVLQLVQNINTPGMVQLGANIPDVRFLPTRTVSRALSVVANRHGQDASATAQVQRAPSFSAFHHADLCYISRGLRCTSHWCNSCT